MTQAQKIIKYFAVTLAIFLVIAIFATVIFAARIIFKISESDFVDDGSYEQMQGISATEDASVTEMEIDISAVELLIKSGDEFKLETDSKGMNYEIKNGKLKVWEKNRKLFSTSLKEKLTIWIPQNNELKNVEIDSGAGNISIENLVTQNLSLDLGAGNLEIEKLDVQTNAEIDGGAGKIIVKSGNIANLDLDMGVGELDLTAYLNGKNDFDLGVGATKLSLIGKSEDYRIQLDKGLGSAKLSGVSMKDGVVYGDGVHSIDINGGVGSIDISFKAA